MGPLIVQKRTGSSVHGNKSTKKWPKWTDVAFRYYSSTSDSSPNCALSLLIRIKSLGDLKETLCVIWSTTSPLTSPWWNKLCLMFLLGNPRCLLAIAISKNAFELKISSHELLKTNKYFAPLISNESIISNLTLWTNTSFSNSFCTTS